MLSSSPRRLNGKFSRWITSVACAAATLVAPAMAQSLVAPGVDCKLDPVFGSVCGLYHDIAGSADAGERRDYSAGTGTVLGSSYDYQGRADSGSAFSYGSAASVAFATFGLLRSYSAAIGGTNGEPEGFNAGGAVNTTVGFTDSLRIISPSLAGQSGTVRAKLLVDGSLSATSQGGTGPSVIGSSFAQLVFGGQAKAQRLLSEGGLNSLSGESVTGEQVYDINVVFGDNLWNPFSVFLGTAASASAVNILQNPTAASGLADFGNTLAWGGLVSVLDSTGQPVNDWTMQSASGFDYSRSFISQVPEPGSWVLMLAGLLAVGCLKKRRAAH